jgi:cyclic pyranopterin phosphate synthase
LGKLTHIDSSGKVSMVDTGGKNPTLRIAVASVAVNLNSEAYTLARDNKSAKGDVVAVATLAGIQAAKRTWELIPLCHQIPLDHVKIDCEFNDSSNSILITATVRCSASTGVEMEALTACSLAALTVYDMLKAVQKDICITDLRLLEKQGGKSGDYKRPGA